MPVFKDSKHSDSLDTPAHRREEAFTLIELMVVIAIIALVFGIIITSANLVKKNSRDAKRQSDLRAIQSALEQYRADQVYYPTSLSAGSLSSGGKTYINTIPVDPSDGSAYPYRALDGSGNPCSTNCLNYCLYAALENPPNPAPARYTVCDNNSPNTAKYNLELTQP